MAVDNPWLSYPLRRAVRVLKPLIRYRRCQRGSGCIISAGGSIGGLAILGRRVIVGPHVNLHDAVIGDYSYLGNGCSIADAEIGKYCSIASEVHIGLGTHPLAPFVSTHPIFYLRRRFQPWQLADRDYRSEYAHSIVGNDVWIGLRAAIRDGVTVGDGAVIAAGAIVAKDVPPYAIVGGVPARIIRYRFTPGVIQFLLEFKWWNRSEEWLKANWRLFHDVAAFVQEFQDPSSGDRIAEAPSGNPRD